MKQKILKLFFATFCLLTSMSAFATTIVTINGLNYELKGTEAYVVGYVTGITNVVIPETIMSEGLTFKVTQVNDEVFNGCETLKSIRSEGDNLKRIGSKAFYACPSLVSVSFPSITTINPWTFYGCKSLTSISFPRATTIGNNAFHGCVSLSTVTFPSVITINSYAFEFCQSLSSVSCPNVTTIGEAAFLACFSLTSVLCPNVTTLETNAFNSCQHLVSVSFPHVITIANRAFIACSELQNVWLGYSLKSLGSTSDTTPSNGVFYDCKKLSNIILPATCKVGNYAFANCDRLQSIIYLGTQTDKGSSNAVVYNINSMATWAQNVFSYSGKKQSVAFTYNLPIGFQPVNGTTIYDLEKNAGFYSTAIPITFSNTEQEFLAEVPYSYTITPGSLTAHVKDVSKVYGDANPQFQTEYTGFIAGEDESVLTNKGTYSTSATASSSVGTYSVTQSGAVAPNYTLQYAPGTLTVTKAPLTMTPRNKTMTYGDRLPTFDVEYVGLKNNEMKPTWTTEPSITTTASSTSYAGTYPITITNGVAKNYNVTFNQGTLTINKAALTTTTLDATREYGDENPDFKFSYSGLKNGETAPEWAVAPSFASAATKNSPVGTYDIVATGGEARNYTVQFINAGKLTVTKAPLTAIARSYTKKQGEDNPIFMIDYQGFKNGETKQVISVEPTITTSATVNSSPGNYEIAITGGIAMNYTFKYVNGTLTIVSNDNPEIITDNVLSVSNFKGNRNSQVVMPIALTNKQQITGLQFDLYLPEGVTVATNSKGKMLITTTDRMDGSYSISSNVIDNSVRIVGYSADGDAFSGDSGDILNITLNIGNAITDGDYVIRIKDIVLSDVNSKEYHPNDAGAILTIKSYTLGDVDNSGAININDVVCIINYILNKTNGTFIEEAADIDGSGTININDVVTLINKYILNKNSAKAFAIGSDVQDAADIIANNYLHLATINIAPGETKEVEMLMTNANNVSATQGNIKLPQGISFVLNSKGKVDAKNIDARSEDFTLSCAIQADGSLTFAHYSADGYTYDGNEGGIFKFKIKADENATAGSYDIDLSGIVLSIDGVGYDIPNRSSSLIVTGTDGISSIENNVTLPNGDYYTLDGMKIDNTPKKKGIYIVNGKKVVVK